MASIIDINGIGINHEVLGPEGAPAVILTPGGRFPLITPGLRELGEELVKGGKRVVLWDRPNCGESDLCLDGHDESTMHADTLAALVRKLDLGKVVIAGGSAGSRVSMIAAARHPEICSHLCIWWITGGNIGLMNLGMHYAGQPATLASETGMKSAAEAPGWLPQGRDNPRIRDGLLKQDLKSFLMKMQQWAVAFVPPADSPVPCMTPKMFAQLTMPVLLVRNGFSDFAHPRETTNWLERLIPDVKAIEARWPDTEWNDSTLGVRGGTRTGLFTAWPKVAQDILDFTK